MTQYRYHQFICSQPCFSAKIVLRQKMAVEMVALAYLHLFALASGEMLVTPVFEEKL